MNIGILGGGLTGLVVGSGLKHQYQIFEKEEKCGGLCRTFIKDGYTWDYCGAHILFSKNQSVIDLEKKLLGKNLAYRRRNNKVYFKDKLVKYPFENGLSELDPQDKFDCLYYYLFNSFKKKPTNLEEWFYFTFGKGIAEKYLLPYNQKIWNIDPSQMGIEWVERIPKPPAEDVIKSALGVSTEGYKHQLNFLYPDYGGVEELVKVFQKRNKGKIINNFLITKLVRLKNQWKVVSDKGEEFFFDKIVSTIPLNELVFMLKGVKIPAAVKKAAKQLRFNSEINVLLGIGVKNLNDITAIYIPDRNFLPNRVYFPGNFSPYAVPPNQSAVAAEIIVNPLDPALKWSKKKIIKHIQEGLEKRGIIPKNKVIYSQVRYTKYAYVVYDKNYFGNMKILRNFFADKNIFLCGRFGDFMYINTDVCIENGLKLATELNR